MLVSSETLMPIIRSLDVRSTARYIEQINDVTNSLSFRRFIRSMGSYNTGVSYLIIIFNIKYKLIP